MTVAPPAAALTLAAVIASAARPGEAPVARAIFVGAIPTEFIGTGFHLRNIHARPGGFSMNNLFYRARFGAPDALVLAGVFGLGALAAGVEAVDRSEAGRGLAAATATGIFGLTAEVGLLHFRGAYHNPLTYAPVLGLPLSGIAGLERGRLRAGAAQVDGAL